MVLEMMFLVVALLLLAQVLLSHNRQRRALDAAGRLPPRLERYPSVTVIRPIRGLDSEAEANIRAALDTGYPGEVETIFVFDDLSEPALPLVRQAILDGRRRGSTEAARASIQFAGPPPAGRTGKLNAMIAASSEARGEVLVFADSDIRPDRSALRILVETLLDPRHPETGAAFAPVVATRSHATAGDAGYALLLNGLYGPAAAAAAVSRGGTLPFIMGQFMAWKRETITAIGGLASAEGQLVDDMYLGARVEATGRSNRVSPHPVPIIEREMSNPDFIKTYRRWITFSRSGLPGLDFKLTSWARGAVFWLGLLGAPLAAVLGAPAVAVALALAPLAVTFSVNRLHVALGGARLRSPFQGVAFALLASAPLIYLSVFFRHEVSWRGRTYRLDAASRLAPSFGNSIASATSPAPTLSLPPSSSATMALHLASAAVEQPRVATEQMERQPPARRRLAVFAPPRPAGP